MSQDRVLSMVGLAKKARRLAAGESAVEDAVKSGKAKLVLVAADASENTRKLFTNRCTFYQVPLYFYSDKESLGRALGRDIQASVAIQDTGMADAVIKILENDEM